MRDVRVMGPYVSYLVPAGFVGFVGRISSSRAPF